MMGDERVSRESGINNFLQLQSRYAEHPILQHLLPTVPEEDESTKDFALRVENIFFEKLASLTNVKIIQVLGVGSDGHTAGIFPMDKPAFLKIYQDDLTYVPVTLEGLTIDSRASFTPHWILKNVDELIGYAIGADKQEILMRLNSEDKKLHERPVELLKLHKRTTLYTDQDIVPEAESEQDI